MVGLPSLVGHPVPKDTANIGIKWDPPCGDVGKKSVLLLRKLPNVEKNWVFQVSRTSAWIWLRHLRCILVLEQEKENTMLPTPAHVAYIYIYIYKGRPENSWIANGNISSTVFFCSFCKCLLKFSSKKKKKTLRDSIQFTTRINYLQNITHKYVLQLLQIKSFCVAIEIQRCTSLPPSGYLW